VAEKILDLDPFILAAEKKQDLPPGLLKQIIDEAGTGIPPKARASILEKFGLDAKLSNANAVEAAGILLSDALANNKGDAGLALAEYRSGKDRAEWGTDTAKFVRRVRSGRGVNMAQVGTPQRGPSSAPAAPAPAPAPALPNMSALGASTGATTPVPVDPVTGSGVDVGKLMQSTGEVQKFEAPPPPPPSRTQVAEAPGMAPPIPAAAGEPEGPVQAVPGLLAAFKDGTMPEADRAEVRRLVAAGGLLVPEGFSLEEPGMATQATAAVKGAANLVTGNDRRTPETEAAPDWMTMPSTEKLSQAAGIAFLSASPTEALQILQANVPGVKVRQDQKGNLFATDPMDGVEYAVKPGFRMTDIPRAVVSAAPFLATGGAASIPAMMGREALVQGGIEAAQSSQGGEFNPMDIAAAGLTAGIVPGAAALKGNAGKLANAALDAVPGSTTSQAIPVDLADAATVVSQKVAAPAAAAASTDAIPMEQLGGLVREANKTGPKATAARVELARLASINPEADAAIKRLGMDAPLDLLSDNAQIKNVMGLARSKIGSEAQAQFEGAIDSMVARADDRMKEFGAITVDGAPSQSGASTRVLESLNATQKELRAASSAAHDAVDEVIPKATEVRVEALREFLTKVADDVGVSQLSPAERQLFAFASEAHPTYGGIKRAKALVGKALEGKLGDAFSNMDTADLKRLYGAIAQSQGDAVEEVGGKVLRDQLDAANKLSVSMFDVQDRIKAGFGREGNGDLAGKMTRAMTAAKSDGAKPLMDLLDVVPENLHKDVVSTAMASAASKGGQFSPEAFVSFYKGLRTNEAAYNKIAGILGPESREALQDMYVFSKRLAGSKKKVQYTGKANQELEAALAGDNLIFRILETAPGKGIAAAVGGTAGSVAGPMGSMAGAGAAVAGVEALLNQRKNVLPAIGKLMSSEEFGDLARMANTMPAAAVEASPTMQDAIRKVATSQRWRDFAKAANMPRDPKAGEQFLSAALQAARQTRGEQ
jgi:hypothetical protein